MQHCGYPAAYAPVYPMKTYSCDLPRSFLMKSVGKDAVQHEHRTLATPQDMADALYEDEIENYVTESNIVAAAEVSLCTSWYMCMYALQQMSTHHTATNTLFLSLPLHQLTRIPSRSRTG